MAKSAAVSTKNSKGWGAPQLVTSHKQPIGLQEHSQFARGTRFSKYAQKVSGKNPNTSKYSIMLKGFQFLVKICQEYLPSPHNPQSEIIVGTPLLKDWPASLLISSKSQAIFQPPSRWPSGMFQKKTRISHREIAIPGLVILAKPGDGRTNRKLRVVFGSLRCTRLLPLLEHRTRRQDLNSESGTWRSWRSWRS